MACETASLPWARCRTRGASAETRCAAASAASLSIATTRQAGSTAPAAGPARQRKAADRTLCAPPHFHVRASVSLAHHHAAMEEQQQLGGRAAGRVGCEQPIEPVRLVPDLVAMQRNAGDIVSGPALGTACGNRAKTFRLDEFDATRIGEAFFRGDA